MVSFTKDASLDLLNRNAELTHFRDSIYSRLRPSLNSIGDGGSAWSETGTVDTKVADVDGVTDPIQESRALLLRWRAGDEVARQQLIEANIDLAKDIAKKKAKKYKTSEEDLCEVALFVLVNAVDSLFRCLHDNARNYLAKSIHNGIKRELKSKWEYEKQYKEVDLDLVPELPAPDENLIDVWDELMFCCESDLDFKIIKMKSEQYTLAEISDRVKKPVSTVQYRLRKVDRLYLERNAN
jgi:DNA-directed RNA polymerase specialized sigma24 family protein